MTIDTILIPVIVLVDMQRQKRKGQERTKYMYDINSHSGRDDTCKMRPHLNVCVEDCFVTHLNDYFHAVFLFFHFC